MRHNEVRWERMFPDELEAAFEACPMVYLPYGLCETRTVGTMRLGWMRFGHTNVRVKRRKHTVGLSHHRFIGTAMRLAATVHGDTTKSIKNDPWLTAIPPWMFL